MKSYSKECQDLFALYVTNNKFGGSYVEIGAGEPVKDNNTYLLESKFSWHGISIEIRPQMKALWDKEKRKLICADATKIDYKALFRSFGLPVCIDYLQIDCNPPATSFKILTLIPFDKYIFKTITFEHDHYKYASTSAKHKENRCVREESRIFLNNLGYVMVVDNMCSKGRQFEDWYVHPATVDDNILDKLMSVERKDVDPKYYIDSLLSLL